MLRDSTQDPFVGEIHPHRHRARAEFASSELFISGRIEHDRWPEAPYKRWGVLSREGRPEHDVAQACLAFSLNPGDVTGRIRREIHIVKRVVANDRNHRAENRFHFSVS